MSLKQRVKLEVEGHDDEIDVTFDSRDIRAWELKNRRSAMVEPVSFSFLTWCGWHAAKRYNLLNGTGDSWEKFDAVCTGVEAVADPDDEAAESAEGAAEDAEVRPTKRSKKAATPKTPSDD